MYMYVYIYICMEICDIHEIYRNYENILDKPNHLMGISWDNGST